MIIVVAILAQSNREWPDTRTDNLHMIINIGLVKRKLLNSTCRLLLLLPLLASNLEMSTSLMTNTRIIKLRILTV